MALPPQQRPEPASVQQPRAASGQAAGRGAASGQAAGRTVPTGTEPDSRRRLRRVAILNIVVNAGIILTGGVVRLTGSGLGCPDWPTCEGTRLLPDPGSDGASWHQMVEFGNRLLTFLIVAVAVAVVMAARREAARGGGVDVRRLAWWFPAGVAVQAVVGGISVLTELHWGWVALHYLLSAVLVAAATVLHDRVRLPQPGDEVPVPVAVRRLAPVVVPSAGLVLVVGTLVTASGPHAGDPGTARLGVHPRLVAFLHADLVWLLVGLSVATLVVAWASGHARTTRMAAILVAVELGQGAIGYAQYAAGIPAALVSLHLVGSALLWVAAWRLVLQARRPTSGLPSPAAASEANGPVSRHDVALRG